MNNTEKKMTFKDYAVVSSLLFGLFFGAGNLIFPLHLGQLAGHNWGPAALGFLVTGVLLPLLSVLAIAITRAKGVYDVGLPLGTGFALTFMVLIHATIGPLFGTPRTATVAYEVGLKPFLGAGNSWGLLLFSALFFGASFAFSYRENDILSNVGKVLNPLFLALLTLVFVVAFASPLGSTASAPVTVAYSNFSNALTNGFLEGYNTMDALASIAFGITVVTAVRQFGLKDKKDIALATAKGGSLGILSIGIIYIALILLGAQSVSTFGLAENGGITLTQISHHYMGVFGDALLATLTTVTCLSTSMGLAIACSQAFHQLFSRFSYKAILLVYCLLSFAIANLGLDAIISWSLPVLMFLYPLAITLILLGVCSPLFHNYALVYKTTTLLTLIPAFFDMLNALPAGLKETALVQTLLKFAQTYFPFFDLGFGWVCFSLLGLIIGLGGYFMRKK